MKRIVRNIFFVLLMGLWTASMVSMAGAAEVPTVEVPVSIGISSSYKPAEEYKVTLTAGDGNCPMPEGAVDGAYTATFSGAGEYTLCSISYPQLGIYNYTIRQEQGSHSRGTYDATQYNMRVAVTNAENGGLAAAMIVYVDNVNQKSGSASFTNSYRSSSNGSGGNGGGGGRGNGGSSSGGPGVVADPLTEIDPGDVPLSDGVGELVPILENIIPLSALPKTGDTTNLMLWLTLMLISAGGLAGLAVVKKRMDS